MREVYTTWKDSYTKFNVLLTEMMLSFWYLHVDMLKSQGIRYAPHSLLRQATWSDLLLGYPGIWNSTACRINVYYLVSSFSHARFCSQGKRFAFCINFLHCHSIFIHKEMIDVLWSILHTAFDDRLDCGTLWSNTEHALCTIHILIQFNQWILI